MKTFEENIEKAVAYHGHLCGGQVLGVRISMIALEFFGIDNPDEYKDLIAFVEADRCIADAVTCITNCHMGKRRLKWYDYGKTAASFYDINSKKAIRISRIGDKYPQKGDDVKEFYSKISNDELFNIQEVEIDLKPEDLPGKPLHIVSCEQCGETVLDGRHIIKDGKILCKACANGGYYKIKN